MEKIKPYGNRCFMQILPREEKKTAGGLFIPQNAERKPSQRCKVLVIGPDVVNVKVGDVVLIPPYAGNKIILDDINVADEYFIAREEDLLGSINA
jgi:co-chaperonin GroES (HSP10)